jgi:hypothetical protein
MTATTRPIRRESTAGHLRAEDFRHRAACRSVDPEVFFPTATHGPEYEAQVSIAKAVCAGCPVRAECLAWALPHQSDGIAGGMTEYERRHELARRRAARRGGRLPRPRVPKRPAGGSRAEIAAAGRAALEAGMPVREVAGEFLVSTRTAGRWAAGIHAGTNTSALADAAEGSAGGNRAPLLISHNNALAGTRAEGRPS